jgi:hypothetical protein
MAKKKLIKNKDRKKLTATETYHNYLMEMMGTPLTRRAFDAGELYIRSLIDRMALGQEEISRMLQITGEE